MKLVLQYIFYMVIFSSIAQVPIQFEVSNKKLHNREPIKVNFYKAYAEPVRLEYLENGFSEKQLDTPDNLLSAFASCDSKEWLSKISSEGDYRIIKESTLPYASSPEFKKRFVLEKWSELSFNYQNTNYLIVLVYIHGRDSTNGNFPVLMEEENNNWKLSSNQDLLKLSHFLYLKPSVLKEIFCGGYVAELEEDYWNRSFYIDNYFLLKYKSAEAQGESYKGLTIPLRLRIAQYLKKDVVCNVGANYSLLKKHFYKTTLYSYNQNEMERQYYTRSHSLTKEKMSFDSIPELALASWFYSKSWSSIAAGCIDCQNLQDSYFNYYKAYPENNRIYWRYKVSFKSSGIEYALIYFSDWHGVKSNAIGIKDHYIYDKRCLLKKNNNGLWRIISIENSKLKDLISSFDKLNMKGIKEVLRSSEEGRGGYYDYFVHAGIIIEEFGNIILTDNPSITDEFTRINEIPSDIKLIFEIKNIFSVKE